VGGYIYISPPRMIYFGMHGLAVRPDWPVQASRLLAPSDRPLRTACAPGHHGRGPTGQAICQLARIRSRAESPRRTGDPGSRASTPRANWRVPPSRAARRRRLGPAGPGVRPGGAGVRGVSGVSPRSRCAVPVRAPQVPVRGRSFPPPADPRAPAPPSRPPTGRRPSPAGSDAVPPTAQGGGRSRGRSQTPARHRATAAPPRGPPALAPRRHARAPHARRSPSDPPPQRPFSPASGLARFASTHTLRPHLGGRTWCSRSCAVKVLPGTGLTMGVHRARLTFPYKVGHFVKSAGPLRADLVKIRNASRPGHDRVT
jgi:hypothetical protein